jgi:two-component system NarL family sensor kinase
VNDSSTVELQKRNRELSILNTIAQALNHSMSLDAALETTLAQVADLLALETGWIWLLDESTGESYLAAARNLPPALRDDPQQMTGSCTCLDMFCDGELEGAINIITCSRLSGLKVGTAGLRHHASVPLYSRDGKELGVFNVASQDWRQLSRSELQLLHTVGDLLGIAVERARLFERSVDLGALKERNRLAREIHDTLAQTLSAITLHLETLEALIESGAEQVQLQNSVARALSLARSGLEEARRSVLDLRAAPLEGKTLAAALATLAEEWTDRGDFTVVYRGVDDHRPLPTRIEIGLYRIAQEALTNVARHARAATAELVLSTTPDQIQLTVQDNGIGFDAERSDMAGRFGIKGIGERARLLGGEALLETCPGQGVSLTVRVPL